MKTTSFIQSFDLDSGYTSSAEALIVRPPKTIRVFRCTIFATDIINPASATDVYVSNIDNPTEFNAFKITNGAVGNTLNTSPTTSITSYLTGIDRIQFDRRGVGYMADTFYIWGKGQVSIIWEGEID